MEARIAIAVALLAGLLAADSPVSSDPRTCHGFVALSEAERLLFVEGLYEGYTAAILRAMIIADHARNAEHPTEAVKRAGAGVKAFAQTAGVRPVRPPQLVALLLSECFDPATERATPVSSAFAAVAARLGPEAGAQAVPPRAPTAQP